jgi:glycine/D-amino acid oxidase-like deaminating enzyme
MKAAYHRTGVEPDGADAVFDEPNVPASARASAIAAVEGDLGRWFSPAPGPLTRAETCFYTNFPDDEFLVERSVFSARVLVAATCSGHSFKLAPVTGRRLAERLISGE